MDPSLEVAFEREMWRLYEEPIRRFRYTASYFRDMLQDHGALETARRLAGDPRHHEGLTRLWELGALDLSVEALVSSDDWRGHFESHVVAAAEKKLDALDYHRPGAARQDRASGASSMPHR